MSGLKSKYGISGIIAVFCLFILIITGTFSLQSCKKNNSFKIGVIISLSGPGAHMSEVLDGIQFAAEEINKYGGVNGKKIELIVRDNETNPEKAVSQFNELEEKYKPDIYITALSVISTALVPLAEKSEAPLLCLVTTGDKTMDSKKWIFRFYSSPDKEILPVNYFIKKLKIKNIGVLYLDDAFGNTVLAELKKNIPLTNIKIDTSPYDRKKIKASEAALAVLDKEAVYIIGYPVDYKEALITLKENRYKGYIMAAAGASVHEISSLSEADGIYIAAPAIYNAKYPFAAALISKMENRYNSPLNHYGANGYESLKLLAGLFSDKQISRSNIQSLLSSGFIFTGSLGKINVRKGEHEFNFELIPAKNVKGILEYE